MALGLNCMFKAFLGPAKITGKFEEDLDYILETSETYAGMCDLSQTQIIKAMPIFICVNDLSLFNKEYKALKSFKECITLLKAWYCSR